MLSGENVKLATGSELTTIITESVFEHNAESIIVRTKVSVTVGVTVGFEMVSFEMVVEFKLTHA